MNQCKFFNLSQQNLEIEH